MKASYTGSNYQLLWAQSFSDAMANNGAVDIGGGRTLPRLTNGQLVALAAAWKRAAARSKDPRWPQWYELTIAALGWRAAGDKFVMTREHANAIAPNELLEFFWNASKLEAQNLDGLATKLRPLIVKYSYDGYEEAARDAWHIMKTEAKKAEASPVSSPMPALETSSDSPAKPRESSGWGNAVLLIVLVLAAGAISKKRNRRSK